MCIELTSKGPMSEKIFLSQLSFGTTVMSEESVTFNLKIEMKKPGTFNYLVVNES